MEIRLKKEIVAEKIRSMIRNGELTFGTKLPRGTEFAKTLGVSHITLRAAFEDLAREGVVSLVQGKGTYVTGDGLFRAAGKILIIRDSFHSLRNVCNYILPGFEKRCCELQIVTETVSWDFIVNSSVKEFRKKLRTNGFSGVLVPCGGFSENEPFAPLLRECGVPVLVAHGTSLDPERSGLPVLRTNYGAAWDDGVKFLRSCGRKRIAFLANSLFKVKYYTEDELLERLAVFGAEADKKLLAGAFPADESFNKAVEKLLQASPDAFFCGSDLFAMRICELLTARKIRIPEDIAVLGFGGYPGGDFCTPALSTVDFQYTAIGERAAELLADPRKVEERKFDVFTSHKILIRESAVPKK